MFLRILKKDLKRKKSVNLILLIFTILATMFIAGGIKNLITTVNATDDFINEAQVKDYLIITMENEENEKRLEEFLAKNENTDKYYRDEMIYLSQTCMKKADGTTIKITATVVMSEADICHQKFFDKNDNEITDVKSGYIYFPKKIMEENDLKDGDIIKVCAENGYEKELKIAGCSKDAFLGSDLMGVKRVLVNDEDFDEINKEGSFSKGCIYSADVKDMEKFVSEFIEENIITVFSADKELIKTAYVMDMIIAVVLLMVSLCLIIIAVIMLRFTIVFTVNEDFREIGIMKAIGIKDLSIRKLYLVKYSVITLAGVVIGFFASMGFCKIMLTSLKEIVVVKKENTTVLLQIVISIMVALIIILFSYISTGKIKKMTPMSAIRSGNSGERFNKKGMKMSKTGRKVTTFMAYNDIFSEKKKYIVLLLVGVVGTWLVNMPVNTINTLKSPKIAYAFSMTMCDIVITDDVQINKMISSGNKEDFYTYLEESSKKLKEAGIPVKNTKMEIASGLKIQKGDKSYKALTFQGLNTDMSEYKVMEGTMPKHNDEIAITHILAERIDAVPGDTVYLYIGEEKKEFMVTAIYQSMSNMGESIRVTKDADIDESFISICMGMQVELDKEYDEEKIEKYIESIEKMFPDATVSTFTKYLGDMIGGVTDKIDACKYVILAVVMMINIMTVVLIQKMIQIRERGEIAMLKAIGFSTFEIKKWQIKRIVMTVVTGVIIGVITSTPFSQLTSGQAFKIMGMRQIEFIVEPLEVYLIYPVMLIASVFLGIFIAVTKINKISTTEINSME